MAAATAGTYVFPVAAGGAVTANAGMTLSVAAIIANSGVVVNGTLDTTGYAGGTTVIATADATNPRRDYVWYDGAGAIGNTSGTAGTRPKLPDLTAGRIALAEIYVAANDTTISGATEITDRRHNIPSEVWNYKSATQVRTTDTTYVDVIGVSPATFTFYMPASSVWIAQYHIPVAFGGTGGVKMQLTGPAAPTSVDITGTHSIITSDDAGNEEHLTWAFPAVAAFSTAIVARSSVAAIANNSASLYSGEAVLFNIQARIINGATAGAVVLQAGQNSSNSTTTLGIGCTMHARRIA